MQEAAETWKRGLPPGPYYEGMTDDYEVYFSPGGMKWHRRRQTALKARATPSPATSEST